MAGLVAWSRRLDLAEDALADAFAAAAAGWRDELPDRPAAWLRTTARRRLTDRIRAEAMARRKYPLLMLAERDRLHSGDQEAAGEDAAIGGDERLRLVMMCCHPALAPEHQSALALRLVLGVPTEELARLFLVSSSTMSARLTRAKRKIVAAGLPFGLPPADRLDERIEGAFRAAHLAFTAGYAPRSGDQLVRADLAGEAIRLTRVLLALGVGAAVGRALLSLQLMQHARRDARTRGDRPVLLPDQDRSLWRHDEIAEAIGLLAGLARTTGWAEELRLQALIAAEHATAAGASETDWARISALYATLETFTRSPVVRLNRAVAVAESDGPERGLSLLEGLEARLPEHARLRVVRAELARRAGMADLAEASYREALELSLNAVEHAHVRARLAELTGRSG